MIENNSLTIKDQNTQLVERLQSSKQNKFLTSKIFGRISENLHYEIFKYMNPVDMLTTKLLNFGGYQLASNRLFRSRLANFFTKLYLDLKEINHTNITSINLIFEQTGQYVLECKGKLTNDNLIAFTDILKQMPQLIGLILCI